MKELWDKVKFKDGGEKFIAEYLDENGRIGMPNWRSCFFGHAAQEAINEQIPMFLYINDHNDSYKS
jgi:hypothetical protein